ncbi:hypothetical protein [Streptomyces scabiei]|uniref:hypothetical protein n=1 Tax=Streptomyces scabiei TaxID=1930 RepID=UPI000A3CAE72|nr:hypothetical protein [Streptomyces scabiei]
MTVRNYVWFTHAVFHGSDTFQHTRAEHAKFWLDSFRAGADFRWARFASPPEVRECEAVGHAERHWPDSWVELTSEDARGFVDSWPVGVAAIVEKAHAVEIRAWRESRS